MGFFMFLLEDTTKNIKNKGARVLRIQPLELNFTFELEKQNKCAFTLTNTSDDDHVAFQVITPWPLTFPETGIMKPNSTCKLTVIIQAQSSYIDFMRCKDKILIQSKILPFRTTQDDVSPEMFADDYINYTEENTLWIVALPPLSQAYSPGLNLMINIDRLLGKLDSLEAEFNTSKTKEGGGTTTRVHVKPIIEMSICEFVRVWGWKILFPGSVTILLLILTLLFVIYYRGRE
ncbi:hypothetical protein DCAR_0101715 [Daucus carota subsp. sativus]|uniref:MSP domain-containing protein n=1 Tax=Daucus carota subsp. sativus TaxID=79200 RepID=A0AAF0W3I5_DAUCS|nr:PREDICTED: vesicle-associated protein 1-1-like [Daucus carota subsp. sativus]WOG82550.1 hypothetical protein DCAR_0101715 [Daucus carota subsp. sativus]